jgi:hypothetical protein
MLIDRASVVELTVEDLNSALGVGIVSVMSARRIGVKKGLLRSQGKFVESLQIRGRIALRTENIIMEFYLDDEKGVTLLPGNFGSERGIGMITMSKYESQLI